MVYMCHPYPPKGARFASTMSAIIHYINQEDAPSIGRDIDRLQCKYMEIGFPRRDVKTLLSNGQILIDDDS